MAPVVNDKSALKDVVLSAFLPPVGRRSFRSREMNVFIY